MMYHFFDITMRGGENMSSFILKQYPILLRNMNMGSSFKALQKLESRYEEGIDSYNQFIDECRNHTSDAYPSYLN